MFVVERFPRLWNTGVAVTEENKERVYRVIRNLLSTIKLIIVTGLVFLAYNSTLSKNLPIWFTPVFLLLIFGSLVFFIVRLVRAK